AMPSYAESGLSRAELWAVSGYVAGLAAQGRRSWVARWRLFLGGLGFAAPRAEATRPDVPPAFPDQDGCLRCHRGIEDINDKMEPVVVALAGGRRGAACAVCHGGEPDGPSERAAHRGLLPNPGSLWAVGLGQGCGACHAAAGSLATFQGHELPLPVGGRLMSVVSTVDDPTGATGAGHAYRVPRGLMAAELGKATTTLAANGLVPKGGPAYADVPIDDPDGPAPAAGSPAYRAWVGRAIDRGFLRRVERAAVIPDAAAGRALFGTLARAAIGDMFRKDCARCHLWDRGAPGAGGRHRSEGCSACHVLYGLDGLSHSRDPTLAGEGAGHPLQHRLTAQIPSSQCAHCHWKGGGYYSDLHYRRGLECEDCHDSIDVHGDGNVYPTMHLQVSVACEDCHGTPTAYPWELPVGWGTPVTLDGPRGVFRDAAGDHLTSSRGNVEARWLRRGDQAVLVGLDGREHPIPLLRNLHLHGWGSEAARVAMDAIPAHASKLECIACHVKRIVQCQGCHVESDFSRKGVDWVASASARPGPFGDPGPRREDPGHEHFEPSNRALVEPTLGVDLQGRVTGLVPGCLLSMRVTDPDGGVTFLGPQRTSQGLSADTLAPLIPHAVTRGARSCESCHTSPGALGYGVAQGRDLVAEPPPVPERRHELMGRAPEPPASAHGIEAAAGGAEASERFDVNRLVTREGRQTRSLADPGERPLSQDERDETEREGVCLACHRLGGTPAWDVLVKKVGHSATPAEHDRAVGAILDGYLRSAR
ncbi:MAG TPA: hypothetical protein VMB50_14365, partial [Myxococcales bacterium]|nr:hypothetical protein [Myxococcales bacterium]